MSTNNLRVIAAALTAIIAVLTGIVAGLAGAGGTNQCTATITKTRIQPMEGDKPEGLSRTDPKFPDQRSAPQCNGADASFSIPAAGVAFLGAAVAGGIATAFLFLRRPEGASRARAVPVPAGTDPVVAQRLDTAETERATLRDICIYVRDRATSKAIADRLGMALQQVGVTTVAPIGAAFDSAHHEAGGATATGDRNKVGTIAAVEVPGYLDRGAVVRAPVVTVYREERT